MTFAFEPVDALLIADAQNDCFPTGALDVSEGDKIILILKEMAKEAQQKNFQIIASRDRHPENHCSFKENGGPRPKGAAFYCTTGADLI